MDSTSYLPLHTSTIPSDKLIVAAICFIFPIFLRLYIHTVRIFGQLRPWIVLKLHTLTLQIENDITLKISKQGEGNPNENVYSSTIGCNVPTYFTYSVDESPDRISVVWPDFLSLEIIHKLNGDTHIYEVKWTSLSGVSSLEDHLMINSARWYGHGTNLRQYYPLEKWHTRLVPCIPQSPGKSHVFDTEYFGLVQERLWLNSKGVGLRIDPAVPLFVSVNEKKTGVLRVVAKLSGYFRRQSPLYLSYCLFQTADAKQTQQCSIKNVLDATKLSSIDPTVLWDVSILSNTRREILSLARKIIECDMGVESIDTPLDQELIEKMHTSGFKISTHLSLQGCQVATTAIQELLSKCPCDIVGISVMEIANSLNMSPGESGQLKELCNDMRKAVPERMTCVLDAGICSQNLPSTIFRLRKKTCSWSEDGGLLSVIPEMFTHGILGYPFLLSGSVGGDEDNQTDGELYIRWLQTTILFPFIEISVPPWHFTEPEVKRIARDMFLLRKSFSALITKLTEEAASTRTPVIRPLWWLGADGDQAAQTISSEFALGDNIIVAPVLKAKARSRDVYLPVGVWRDGVHNNIITGPTWISDYSAELQELPIFYRVFN